jgi:hypothetical protein
MLYKTDMRAGHNFLSALSGNVCGHCPDTRIVTLIAAVGGGRELSHSGGQN